MLNHLPAPPIDGGVQHHIGAGRGEKIGALAEPDRINQVSLQVVDRTLFEAHSHLVDAHHADVCSRRHGPGGKVLVEGQVGAPRFVNDQGLAPFMADFGDGPNVSAGPVGCGAGDEGTCRVGEPLPHLAHGVRRRRMRKMKVPVPARGDPPRLQPGQDKPGHHRLVRVPSDEKLAASPRHRKDGGLDGQRTAAGGKEGLVRAHGLGRQRLGFGQVAPDDFLSSRPAVDKMSERKVSLPRTSSVRASAPRPWRCPGGVQP